MKGCAANCARPAIRSAATRFCAISIASAGEATGSRGDVGTAARLARGLLKAAALRIALQGARDRFGKIMKLGEAFDEMHGVRDGVRKAYRAYQEWLDTMPHERLLEKHQQADLIFRRLGITFSVYGSEEGVERLIPFDVIPRILDAEEWRTVATGVCQRVRAINAFLDDVYHEQHILKSGRIPAQLVLNNPGLPPGGAGARPAAPASTCTSPASTWSASRPTTSTSSRTMRGCRPASPTCWRTGRR